jgi:hypothetical protein
MKKSFILSCAIALSCGNAFAVEAPAVPDYREIASQAVRTADSSKLATLEQVQDAIHDSSEAKFFLMENKISVDLQDFAGLYARLLETNKLHKFKRAIELNDSRTVFLSALAESRKPKHNCKVDVSNYGLENGEQFKRISVICNSSVYGSSHWLQPTDRVSDVYYVAQKDNEWVLGGFEFGLVKTYIEDINQKLLNIKLSLNEQVI